MLPYVHSLDTQGTESAQKMGYEMTLRTSETQAAVKTALDEFAAGLDGKRPEPLVVEMAARIANAALDKTREPEISVDVDGALSFDLELPGGRLLLAELEIDGSIDASLYDSEKRNIKRMPQATEMEIIAQLESQSAKDLER